MHPAFTSSTDARPVPITFASKSSWDSIRATLPTAARRFAESNGFAAKPGQYLALPAEDGSLAHVLFGIEDQASEWRDLFRPGQLPGLLPAGTYSFANAPHDMRLAALAFALGSYRFNRYRKNDAPSAKLLPPADVDMTEITRMADAAALARDLINTPANDMGPAEIAAAARAVAEAHGAACAETVGDELLRGNFPLIHAVGKGSERAPRLVDFHWGRADAPKVTLVGKGVAFDTGGLDIKPPAGMLLMKKDMGGAANILGLARLIMGAHLDVRLRVLIPTVENAISGRAMRPSDIYPSRKGLTVEIGNTDAEGRLILADALTLADEEAPDLLIDMATLTGAARVALGPDLPPFYTDDEALAADLQETALRLADPLWRLPLWRGYASGLDSKVADMNNVTSGGFAGSVTAALFLSRFVEQAKAWVHLDIYGWTPSAKPGRPEGGEAQGIRALYDVIARRYA